MDTLRVAYMFVSVRTWQVFFLFYVTLTVPLRACFDEEQAEIGSGPWLVDTIVDAYFVVDLVPSAASAPAAAATTTT